MVRFAVRWPAQRLASPRSHDPSGRDVAGGVHVGVGGVPTGHASEVRLALARLPGDVPTSVAPLRRERRLELLDSAGRLVLQARNQPAPALIEDGPVQPALLPDTSPRLLDRALRGGSHRPHVQILHPDEIEAASQVGGGLLGPVPPSVGLPGPEPGDGPPGPSSPVGVPRRAGEAALQAPQPRSLARAQGGREQQLPGRKRGRNNHAPVDPHDLAVPRCGNRRGDSRERDMPSASRILGHPQRPGGGYRAGPAKPDPAELWNRHHGPVTIQPPHIRCSYRDDAKSLVAAALAVAGCSGRYSPPSPHGVRAALSPPPQGGEMAGPRLLEVPQRLLLDNYASLCQPRERGSGVSELTALLGESGSRSPSRLPPGSLLDCQVPNVTRVCAVLQQHRLLGECRVQPVAAHPWNLAATCDNNGSSPISALSGPNAGTTFGGTR